MHFLTISFRPLPLPKYWLKCQQTTALDLPFYDIFAPQKVPFLKISDDVIASNLWFGPPKSRILATPMASGSLYPPTPLSAAL